MKAKTRQEIAREYGICSKTLKKWLIKANIEIAKGLINPKDQKKIYKAYGVPKDSEEFQKME